MPAHESHFAHMTVGRDGGFDPDDTLNAHLFGERRILRLDAVDQPRQLHFADADNSGRLCDRGGSCLYNRARSFDGRRWRGWSEQIQYPARYTTPGSTV